MDRVSVIIPAFNCAQQIGKCLDSLARQQYGDLEVIVVDDGSTDGLDSALKPYPHTILIQKSNGGVASARNAGMAAASGEYIMFVDSDDYLDDGCICKLMQKAQSQPADIIRFRFVWEYPDGTVIPDTNELPKGIYLTKKDFPKYIYRQMLTGIRFNSVWRQLFRREVVENLRFRTDVRTVEDAMFNVDAYTKAQSVLLLDGIFYHYYQTGTGLTGSALGVLEKYRCNLRFSNYLIQHLRDWGMDSPLNRLRAIFRLAVITLRKLHYTHRASGRQGPSKK